MSPTARTQKLPAPGQLRLPKEARAERGPSARPPLKWAGGKRQLLPAILKHLPDIPPKGTYFEPFVGGGAVFFSTRPHRAVLADTNPRLMRTYAAIRNHTEEVIALLDTYPHDRDFFSEMRTRPIDAGSDVEVAAWLLYLNHTAFNGLYRVNSKNEFNVPFGNYKSPRYCKPDNLRACAKALQRASLACTPFEETVASAQPGDVVYFDPPYIPLSATSSFTSYTADGFGDAEQVRLRDVAVALRERGVFVLVSNSNALRVHELYQDFRKAQVWARRNINSQAAGRGAVPELLLW